MMVLLGDTVTVFRDVSGDTTVVTGRVSGIVQKDNGDLKYFYIRGIDSSFYISDGWQFDEGEEEENEI
jgi:hypothetical protein